MAKQYKCEPVTKCRICASDGLMEYIDLADQPPSNTLFTRTKEKHLGFLCGSCSAAFAANLN